MGSITRSHSFVSGEKPTESEWNVDIDQLFTLVNGQLDTNNVDTSSSDGVSVLNANQTITGTRTHSGTVTMADDIDLIFGTNSDIKIQYDEGTDDALLIDTGVEGAALAVVLKADQGDDAGDAWKLNVADGGVVTLGNDIASKGSYVTQLTLTPNSTVASSTTAIAGHATVGGNLTVTGGVTVAGASAFDIGDSDKLLLGDSDDLQVYHDGSNSYIANATGALKIATETSGIAVTIGHTTSETTIADNATVTGTLAAGASTLASLTCTAAATFGGGTGSSGATITTAGAGTFDGILKTEDTTAATNTTDGSLQTDGGLSVALDAVVGDDIILLSDSSVIHFGADSDITLTHVADVGLTLGGAGEGTLLKIDNTATDGDSAIQFLLDGGVKYTMGVEDGDSDKFVINYGVGILGAQPALEIDSSGNTALAGTVNLGTVAAAGTDTDKFLVLDSSGNVDYRTGAQVLSDIGAGSAATSGDFSGPGSSTDNAIVRFDGTGGKTGQTSSVLIDDSNNVSGIGALTATGDVSFDGGTFVFNETGADKDFRIEGDSEANLFFADASTDRIGIGTSSPAKLLSLSAGTDTTTGTDPIARFERTGASQTAITVRSNNIDGLILRADSAGLGGIHSYEDLAFYSGATPGSSYGTERMRIDSATGVITIGSATVASVATAADELWLRGSSTGMTISSSGTTNSGSIFFGDADNNQRGRVQYNHNQDNLILSAAGTEVVNVRTGLVGINDTENGKMTQGLTINQGSGVDNEALALKSSTDVAHDCTDVAETDTYGTLTKYYGDNGGLQVTGFVDSGAQAALSLQGVTSHASPQSGKTSSNNGTVNISAYKVSSNDRAQLGANENILSIYGASATRFIFDADGDAYADSQWTTYDDHDDIAMLHDIEATMIPDLFGKCMKYDAEYLQKTGIIGEGSIRQENGKTRAMINTNRLQMLHHGAIRQVHQQLQDVKDFYEDKIAALEARLLRLEA
jgi:hypothetical protein